MIKLNSIQFLIIIILAFNSISKVAGDRALLQFDLAAFDGQDFGLNILAQYREIQLPQAPGSIAENFTQFETVQSTDSQDIAPAPTTCQSLQSSGLQKYNLGTSDFEYGTKIISEPGIYILTSDVSFNPNSGQAYFASDVQPNQFQFYDANIYSIGFFSAIAIATDNVVIDFNGFTIEQSKEHALNQRIFNIVQLGSSPFSNGKSVNNVCIKNGVLGRSSSTGIRGNNNRNIEIRDLTIRDFEVGGIELNSASDVLIENIDVPNTRVDVPVRGRFSAARFIRPWINQLANSAYTNTLNVGGKQLTVLDVQNALKNAINDATNEILQTGIVTGDLKSLFGNPLGFPDGGILYRISTNLDKEESYDKSQHIVIRNFRISRMEVKVREVVALTEVPPNPDQNKRLPVIDAAGSVLETQDGVTITNNGIFVGNPVINAQLLVAKAQNDGFVFSIGDPSMERKQISPKIIAWAESGLPYTDFGITYICSGDSKFHSTKGAIAFKFDSTNDLTCEKCVIDFLRNDGEIGSVLCNDDVEYRDGRSKSNPLATQPGYNGGDAVGFFVSGSSNLKLVDCKANIVLAKAGDEIGFEVVHGSSQIEIVSSFAGVAEGGIGVLASDYDGNPTPFPVSAALRVDNSVSGVVSNLK